MSEILWQPSVAAIEAARVTEFRHGVNRDYGLDLQDYDQLYHWSVTDRSRFWEAVWRFCGVLASRGFQEVLSTDINSPRGTMVGTRWFEGARLNFAENLLRRNDAGEAIVYRREDNLTRRITFTELRREVGELAAALRADGVETGDRVVGFLPNVPEAVIAMLAAASLGAVWSSCSPDFGIKGVRDRFGQIQPKVLFCSDGYLYGGREHDSVSRVKSLLDELPSVERTVTIPRPGSDKASPEIRNARSWNDYVADHRGSRLNFVQYPFNHPLYIMYSSGTTGLPKCMVHSAGGTLLQHLKEHALHCDARSGDRMFYFTTCGWMMWNWLVTGLASGVTLILYDGSPVSTETALWDLAEEERITILGTSARYLAACDKAGLSPGRTHDLSSLDSILSTGSPLSPEQFDWVYGNVKSDLRLSSISGGTDIISCFALGSPVLPVRRGELQCRGLGMDVAVYDSDGNATVGKAGELVCRSAFPSQPIGFWNDPHGRKYFGAYFERFPGVWAHGDWAELRPEGGMIIHGRSDAVLNPGGVRIGTSEIYRVVESFDEVLECIAVGQELDNDTRVVLFVVLQDGLILDDDLRARIRARIREEESPRHVPARIAQVPDIPRTISGKIVELAVRDVIHGRKVKNTDALANPDALVHFENVLELLEE